MHCIGFPGDGKTRSWQNFWGGQTLYVVRPGHLQDKSRGQACVRLPAFSFSTAGGILLAKIINLFLGEGKKINPCIGASGVSAVPMSARVVQQFVSDETNGRVNPLMAAMGPNVAGVIGTVVAAGIFITLAGR